LQNNTTLFSKKSYKGLTFREELAHLFLNTVNQRLSGFEPLSRSVIGSVERNLLMRQTARE